MAFWRELDFGLRRRLPMLLQTEAAECGLACLAMVAGFHGQRVELRALRRRFEISLKGTTLAQLIQVGGALGLGARPLRLELEEIAQLRTPCVLHWNFNHFVVLESAGRSGIVIHDPALGVRRLRYAEASRHFTGIALELTPAPGFVPAERRERVGLRELMGRVVGLKRAFAQVLLLALALEAFALASPLLAQWVVDGVVVSADRDLLVTLAVGFALLAALRAGVAALRSWVVMVASATLNIQWMANVFTHLLRLPVPFFEKRHLGDVVARFGSVNIIQRTLTTSFVEAVLDGVMALVTIGMMLLYAPPLACVSLGAVALYALLRRAWYRPFRAATEEQIVHAAKSQSHLLETVRGVRTIKLFNRPEERRSDWLNLVVEQVNADLRTQKMAIGYRALNELLFGAERIGVIWLGALLVLDAKFSVGMLFAYLAYKDQFGQRVSSLIDRVVELKMLQLHGERLADIVLAPAEEGATATRRSSAPAVASLEVKGLRFRYADHEPWILDGCGFSIADGESVAIAGASGCGKTTLLKLMLGILAPQEGEIRVGGVRIDQLGLAAFRDLVGTVMQDDQLFAGSIADNISFFDPAAEQGWIESCARLAAVHDEIAAMPMAYHTLIGDMGAALSGGQKQRLLLARALYKRPRILFLDEATSHLDIEREQGVNLAIRRLNLTRVIVAHRPQTLAAAHRVIVLSRGRVASELRNPAEEVDQAA